MRFKVCFLELDKSLKKADTSLRMFTNKKPRKGAGNIRNKLKQI